MASLWVLGLGQRMVIIMIIIPSKKSFKTCKAVEVLGRKQGEKNCPLRGSCTRTDQSMTVHSADSSEQGGQTNPSSAKEKGRQTRVWKYLCLTIISDSPLWKQGDWATFSFTKTSGAVARDNEIIDQELTDSSPVMIPEKKGYLTIPHFRNQKETGPSLLSQRLLGLLPGTTKKLSNSWPARPQ